MAGQTHLNLYPQYSQEVFFIPASLEAFGFDADLGGRFLFEQGQGQSSYPGKVFRGVTEAGTAQVLPEANIQRPMEFVFDIPVEAGGLGDSLGDVSGQATDKITPFHGFHAVEASMGFQGRDAFKSRPIVAFF